MSLITYFQFQRDIGFCVEKESWKGDRHGLIHNDLKCSSSSSSESGSNNESAEALFALTVSTSPVTLSPFTFFSPPPSFFTFIISYSTLTYLSAEDATHYAP